MPIFTTRKQALGDAKTQETGENGENSRNKNEDLTNLIQVSCI